MSPDKAAALIKKSDVNGDGMLNIGVALGTPHTTPEAGNNAPNSDL
jgi:hypothetical protein